LKNTQGTLGLLLFAIMSTRLSPHYSQDVLGFVLLLLILFM